VVTLEYAPNDLYRAGLLAGGVLALCVVGAALVRARSVERLRPSPSSRAVWLVLASGVAAGLLLVGFWAVLVAGVAAGVAATGGARAMRSRLALLAGLAVSIVALTGLVGGRDPSSDWGAFGLPAQLLVAVGVAAAVVSAAVGRPGSED
jgi:arabinofuranan 3-O-arabinosyltransferase